MRLILDITNPAGLVHLRIRAAGIKAAYTSMYYAPNEDYSLDIRRYVKERWGRICVRPDSSSPLGIYAFLFTFGFIAYFQQKGFTVAAERIMPELGLSQTQIGSAGMGVRPRYAAFPVPRRVIGQRLGAAGCSH